MAIKEKTRVSNINQAIDELAKQKREIESSQVTIKLIDIKNIYEIILENSISMHNRITTSKAKLSELADNIKELAQEKGGILGTGIIHPVMLRNNNGRLERIIGDSRIKALKLNGAAQVPAIILDNVSDELARFIRSSENLNRDDLNPYDETLSILEHIQLACGFKDIQSVKNFINKIKNYKSSKTSLNEDEKNLYRSVSKVFEKIGRFDVITFVDRLSLLNINDLIKQALVDGYIGYTQATTINSKVKKNSDIEKILKLLEKKNMTISELKKYISNLLNNNSPAQSLTQIYDKIVPTSKIITKAGYKNLSAEKKEKVDKILNKIIQAQNEIKEIL